MCFFVEDVAYITGRNRYIAQETDENNIAKSEIYDHSANAEIVNCLLIKPAVSGIPIIENAKSAKAKARIVCRLNAPDILR